METPNLINIYRFTRLVFGLTCSPLILSATVKAHVQNSINDETIQILTQFLRDLYVDDTAMSFNSSSEALEFYSVCKQVLFKGGFNFENGNPTMLIYRKMLGKKKLTTVIVVRIRPQMAPRMLSTS